jgi:hypothetical protein
MESPKKPSRRHALTAPAREDKASVTLDTNDKSKETLSSEKTSRWSSHLRTSCAPSLTQRSPHLHEKRVLRPRTNRTICSRILCRVKSGILAKFTNYCCKKAAPTVHQSRI